MSNDDSNASLRSAGSAGSADSQRLAFFPDTEDGRPLFAQRLAEVTGHVFDGVPRWRTGLLSRDRVADEAAKAYMAVSDMKRLVESEVVRGGLEGREWHLNEVLAGDRPVRPYVDLEWDAGALENGDEDVVVYQALMALAEGLERVGFRGGRGISVFCASGPSSAYPSGRKASYHVICDMAQVFRCVADHKRFMDGVLMPLLREKWGGVFYETTDKKKCVVDHVPYMLHQNFRLPFQSKWTSGTARPLMPYSLERLRRFDLDLSQAGVWTAGVYEDPAGLEFVEVGAMAPKAPRVSIPLENGQGIHGTESAEFPLAVALCGHLTIEFLSDYEKARNIIWLLWGMEQTERMSRFIHELCGKANNYSAKWVNQLMKGMKFIGFSMGSLRRWAEECSSKEVVEETVRGIQQEISYVNELSRKTKQPSVVQEVSVRYLSDAIMGSPFNETVHTVLIQSHLGTGKTVAIRQIMTSQKYRRILIISPRRSYTYSQQGQLADLDVVSYMDCQHGGLEEVDRLIIQVESLHRIRPFETSEEHTIPYLSAKQEVAPYDLVVLDESESILYQLHSVDTQGANLITNHKVFEWALRSARHVIFADAFLSDRSFSAARLLRGGDGSGGGGDKGLLFLHNTFQPYARQAIELTGTEEDARVANISGFHERIMTALRAGRRVVVIWTSKRRGDDFVAAHLSDSPYRYCFYSSASTTEEQEGLQQVHRTWAGLQCVMMTTTITVGLSYDPKVASEQFDEAFLYGSSSSALPRDVAQALLRVRVLRENRLTYVVDTRSGYYGVRGFTGVWGAMLYKEDCLLRDHPIIKWQEVPDWARWNYVYNENEGRISRGEYKNVTEMYLRWSGYEIKGETHVPGNPLEVSLLVAGDRKGVPSWEEIKGIDADGADQIYHEMKRGVATEEQVWMYKKYLFGGRFRADAWTKEERLGELATWWATFYMRRMEERFWNVYHEKHMTLEDMLREESTERFAMMSTRRVARRKALEQLLGIVGMKHSQEEIVLNAEQLEAIGPKLEAAERNLRYGLGLGKSERKKGVAWKVPHTMALIRAVLREWGLGTAESEVTRKKVEKKTVRTYSLSINKGNTLWGVLREKDKLDMDKFMILIPTSEEAEANGCHFPTS